MKCDYCEAESIGVITYEGTHTVCEKHKKLICELAGRRLLGIKFQDELERRRDE